MKIDVMCDIGFSVVVDDPGKDDLEVKDLGYDNVLAALQKRIDYLKEHKDELGEAIGLVDISSCPDEDEAIGLAEFIKLNPNVSEKTINQIRYMAAMLTGDGLTVRVLCVMGGKDEATIVQLRDGEVVLRYIIKEGHICKVGA